MKFRYWQGVKYVAPHKPAPAHFARCGHCGRAWDDDKPTTWTPAPSGRCPFEYWHKAPKPRQERQPTAAELANLANDLLAHLYGNIAYFPASKDDRELAERAEMLIRRALPKGPTP